MATCEERVQNSYEQRMADLRQLWTAYCQGKEDVEELGNIYEYGLCFDFVGSGTFEGQSEGYYRYQLSWGGPADEFRFYPRQWRIEYWFLDWFDGAKWIPNGYDRAFLMELYDWFEGAGMCDKH